MRWSIVKALTIKEFIEAIRDKRTLVIMILFPILMYPLLGLLLVQSQVQNKKKLAKSTIPIGILGGKCPAELKRYLQQQKLSIVSIPSKQWSQQLPFQKWHTLIEINEDPKAKGNQKIRVNYLSTHEMSKLALKRIQKAVDLYQEKTIQERLLSVRLSQNFISPISARLRDMAPKTQKTRHFLAEILPMMLVLMTIMGAFYPSIDLTAGEKERGTLETLMTAPVSSLEVILSKYFTVSAIATFAGTMNLLSLWLTIVQGARIAGKSGSLQMDLQILDVLLVFLFLVLVAMLSSGLMMTVGSLARSFREGQNYVTPTYLVCIVPTMLAKSPGFPELSTALIPFANISYAIQLTLKRQLTFSYGFLCIASMLGFVSLSMYISSRLFGQEGVLFRTEHGTFSHLLFGSDSEKRKTPNAGEAVFFAIIGFLVLFYFFLPLQKNNLPLGIFASMWLGFLGLSLVFLRMKKRDIRKTLQLHSFPPHLVGAIFLIVVGAIPWILLVTIGTGKLLFPQWEETLRQMNQAFNLQLFHHSYFLFFFLLAFSPAVCEEIFFRGFIQTGLRKNVSPTLAILFSSILFGVFHLSLVRFVPTFLAGILMGWLCFRTGSIFPSMLFHFLNNSISLLFVLPFAKSYAEKMDFLKHPESAFWVLLPALLFLIVGLFWVHKTTQKEDVPLASNPSL